MKVYTATARNYSEESENRMHGDAAARGYGFAGALVPGVAVFGHMATALTQALGTAWLSGHVASTRFMKPAYHEDALRIEHERADDGHQVRCLARGVLLAELRCEPDTPPPDALAEMPGGKPAAGRQQAAWESLHVGEAFPAFHWKPDVDEHLTYAAQVEDGLAIWRDGDALHPHALLSTANRAFSNRFELPAWLHVGSEIVLREPVRIGDDIEVRTVPVEKWRKKGHEFVTLYVAYLAGGVVKTEIRHTAIFKVARKAA